MHIESLEEFRVLAGLLNYSKASASLHVSQSTLSRHIKSMEIELGFPLIGNVNNQLFVTREGNIFLNGINPILDEYSGLVSSCRDLRASLTSELIVQEPFFQDAASLIFLRRVTFYRNSHPNSFVQYKALNEGSLQALEQNIVNVAIDYRHGDIASILQEYENCGVVPVHMYEVPLYVCCREDSGLAGKECLDLSDLDGLPVMTMYDTYSPIFKALESMFEGHGVRPIWTNFASSSVFEFLMTPVPDKGVFILPEGMQNSIQIQSREGFSMVPLRKDVLHFFALFSKDYKESPDLVDFHDCLANGD